MFTKLFLPLLFLFAVSHNAQAGGIVSFAEQVLPILNQAPSITGPILQQVDVAESGDAVRISGRICPGLAGTRVSPYVFEAQSVGKDKSPMILTVTTNVDFFDEDGNVVFRITDGVPDNDDSGLYRAVAYEETFSGISLKRQQ